MITARTKFLAGKTAATALAVVFYAAILAPALVSVLASDAWPHDATPTASQPLGWSYEYSCCSLIDCRAVPDSAIEEGPQGFVIKATGEVIPYSDKKVKQSKDERFHWCSKGGKTDTATICLYVPNRGF